MVWSDIPGWFDFADFYDAAIADAPADRPTVMVEIGVAFGRSLAYLTRSVIESGKPITVVGIDPWVDDWNPDWSRDEATRPAWGAEHAEWARAQGGPFSAFIQSMRTHAPEELERARVLRCKGYAGLAAVREMFPALARHMCFIDGDHRYGAVFEEIQIARNMGFRWIGGHDYAPNFPGVMAAVHDQYGPLSEGNFQHVGNSWVVPPKGVRL